MGSNVATKLGMTAVLACLTFALPILASRQFAQSSRGAVALANVGTWKRAEGTLLDRSTYGGSSEPDPWGRPLRSRLIVLPDPEGSGCWESAEWSGADYCGDDYSVGPNGLDEDGGGDDLQPSLLELMTADLLRNHQVRLLCALGCLFSMVCVHLWWQPLPQRRSLQAELVSAGVRAAPTWFLLALAAWLLFWEGLLYQFCVFPVMERWGKLWPQMLPFGVSLTMSWALVCYVCALLWGQRGIRD